MIGRTNVSGGGLNINGIIQEYVAGGNISAGKFVSYVNDFTYNKLQAASAATTPAYHVSACKLSDTKVFIAHTGTSSYQLYGMLCTITETGIVVESDIQLSSNSNTGYYLSAIALSSTKAIVVHSNNSSNRYIYGIVITINDTTFSKGTDLGIELRTTTGNVYVSNIGNNKLFITYGYSSSSNSRLYGTIASVDLENNSVSGNNATQISINGDYTQYISITTLSADKVYISHSYSSNYNLYGVVCSVNGNTITSGTDTAINSTNKSGYYTKVVTLTSEKVFVARTQGDNSYYMYGIVCNISGTTISKGSDTQIGTQKLNYDIQMVVLSETEVYLLYYNSYEIIATINNTTITTGTETQINVTFANAETKKSLIKINPKMFFLAYDDNTSNHYIYGGVRIIGAVFQSDNNPNILGVANTSTIGGEKTKVTIPEVVS